MKLENVEKLAKELMTEHGFADWNFTFIHRKKRRMGECDSLHNRISLNRYFAENNPKSKIVKVLLHEIAHAISGSQYGHDKKWKLEAKKLGVEPLANFYFDFKYQKGKYYFVCFKCGKVINYFRRPQCKRSCSKCNPKKGFSEKYLMELIIID